MANRGSVSLSLLLVVLVIAVTGCMNKLDPGRIMELNGNGKWSLAAAASAELIRNNQQKSHSGTGFLDTTQAYFHKAYAELRLGQKDRAIATLESLDAYLDDRGFSASSRWMYRELDILRAELALLPTVSRLKAGARLGSDPNDGQGNDVAPVEAEALAAHRRLFEDTGVWQKIHEVRPARLRGANKINFSRAVVDSSSVRAVLGGRKRGRTPRIAGKKARNTISSLKLRGFPLRSVSWRRIGTT